MRVCHFGQKPAGAYGRIDVVPDEDRFAGFRQLGEAWKRSVRRATCALSVRGRAVPVPAGSSRGKSGEPGQPKPVPLLEAAGKPSPYEEAFVRILPLYPEAYRAVIQFMRELVGFVVKPDTVEGRNDGPDKEPLPA